MAGRGGRGRKKKNNDRIPKAGIPWRKISESTVGYDNIIIIPVRRDRIEYGAVEAYDKAVPVLCSKLS